MSGYSLTFEPADWAGGLWAAAALLILLELVRYARVGRRPASFGARLAVIVTIVLAAAVVLLSGRWRVQGVSPAFACAVMAVLVVPWVARSYRHTARTLSAGTHRVLQALRIAAVWVVLMIAASPVLQWTDVTWQRPVLAVALDDSRSMSISDVPDSRPDGPPISRRAAVEAALVQVKPMLDDLAGRVDLRWFTFAGDARPAGRPALTASGDITALAAALRQVRAALSRTQQPPAGILIISDGRQTAPESQHPEEAAFELAAAGIPLYAVGVGSETPLDRTRHLAARRLDVPDRVAAGHRLAAAAEFTAVGLAGQPVTVELLLDGRPVDSRRLDPQHATELLHVDLACTPTEKGVHRVTARAAAALAEPAQVSRFVEVVDDKINVWYADRPRYERAAVVRALAAAEEIRLTRIDLGRPAGGQDVTHWPPDREGWRRIDVFLIGDVDESLLPAGVAEAIASAVRDGSGVARLGAARGRSAASPLAELLPADAGRAAPLAGPVPLVLTPAGLAHPICRLEADPASIAERWKQMPPASSILDLPAVAAGSEVLLETPTGRPLLAVRETGGGRSAIVAFEGTWQWPFAEPSGGDALVRFWRQLVLWLADRRPPVWVRTDRREYDLADLRAGRQSVRITAGLDEGPDDPPAPDLRIEASVEDPRGSETPIKLTKEANAFRGEFHPTAAGDWRITVTAHGDRGPAGRSQAAFAVSHVDRELADPLPDFALLGRMAAETRHMQGGFAPLSDLESVLSHIAAVTRPLAVHRLHRWPLVETYPWVWYAALFILLAGEWMLRRYRGLV